MSSHKTSRLTKEQRSSERVLAQVPARWLRRTGAANVVTADVCARGLFLCTTDTARIGELLKIELALPDGPLTMMVVVRNCGVRGGRTGLGVEVYQLEEDRARWTRFCVALGASS
ncbi:MAG: PilZ domain-containing protein [Myxococcales bacterium]|nr:PilZ domain-containing protein [Myxococcales bacterium]